MTSSPRKSWCLLLIISDKNLLVYFHFVGFSLLLFYHEYEVINLLYFSLFFFNFENWMKAQREMNQVSRESVELCCGSQRCTRCPEIEYSIKLIGLQISVSAHGWNYWTSLVSSKILCHGKADILSCVTTGHNGLYHLELSGRMWVIVCPKCDLA